MKTNQRQFNQKTLIIWRFTDGKIGHEKQSAALIFELEKLIPVKVFEFHANTMDMFRDSFLCQRKYSKYHNTQKPDLIIGVGHRTHLPILLAKQCFGGKSVVIMKPSLPYLFFDFCLIPEHDDPPQRDNVISIIGSLNKISDGRFVSKENGLCTFLIGGPSNHYNWSANQIIDEIEKHTKSHLHTNTRFILTTSRRTPADFLKILKQRKFENFEVFDFPATSKGWVEEILLKSESVLVTPDSISMVYEALSAKCLVGLLKLEPKSAKSRVVKNIDFLIQEGYISKSIPAIRKNTLQPKILPNQAELCALEIISKLFIN